MHQVGANLVADAIEAAGWKVRFLGTNLPHSSVITTLEESAADVLCISTTIVANLASLAELIRTVQGRLGKRSPRIVLGGAAFHCATQFTRELGLTEPVTDLRHALAMLCA
jgi:methanogenic corrinoid protein MtbC1